MTIDEHKVKIIDLSGEFFRQRGEDVPEVRGGKFVVMRDDARRMDYLVLSPSEQCKQHADIVEKFWWQNRSRLSGGWTVRPRRFLIHDPNWSVAGGGRWDWLENERLLRLYGESLMYGACDLVAIRDRLANVPEIADWRIEIEQGIFY